MKDRFYFKKESCFLFCAFYILLSCGNDDQVYEEIDDNLIVNLKWHKAYDEDTFEKQITGLQWSMSYLGATRVIKKDHSTSFIYENPMITIDVSKLGFSDQALKVFEKLHKTIKSSEEYQKNNAIDIGKYIVLTLGEPDNYYPISGVPNSLTKLKDKYKIHKDEGYANNSSISNVDRVFSFSSQKNNKQLFLSTEIDPLSKQPLEFESVEIMSNGQLRFGVYDVNGVLKSAANKEVTDAGKPGKCIWCHEVSIQPFFENQNDIGGYITFEAFQDTLKTSNSMLMQYQNAIWENLNFVNQQNHYLMEISYISFLEPSLERVANEWGMSTDETKEILKNLDTHTHHEFTVLGELYHRKDIDNLSPFVTIKHPNSVREVDF